MRVSTPRITASVNGSTWTFQVAYRATFTQDEVNQHFRFADRVRIMEDDDTSGDDVVSNWSQEESWVPDDTQDDWTWTVRVNEDAVDTELGGEEIYGQISLRNVTTSSGSIVGTSQIINVSPD
jgi:hypothetical protein